MVDYDEFSMLADNAREVGLAWSGPPIVRRVDRVAPSGRTVSAIVWGDDDARLVLLHGGGQNAHTWDTTVLALGYPLVAIDLPGHGHSGWRDDHDYRPQEMAADVAATFQALAPHALALVGMSLGGLTSLAISAAGLGGPARLGLVDITPGVNREKSSAIEAFLSGPETFASFDEILERTILFNPTRSESSLRRGVLHNARERPDGSWEWRYDRPKEAPLNLATFDPSFLWDAISGHNGPLLLARGADSPVVDDDDVAELRRRRPDAEVLVVEGAGHSIQGDRPVELAAILAAFLA